MTNLKHMLLFILYAFHFNFQDKINRLLLSLYNNDISGIQFYTTFLRNLELANSIWTNHLCVFNIHSSTDDWPEQNLQIRNQGEEGNHFYRLPNMNWQKLQSYLCTNDQSSYASCIHDWPKRNLQIWNREGP